MFLSAGLGGFSIDRTRDGTISAPGGGRGISFGRKGGEGKGE